MGRPINLTERERRDQAAHGPSERTIFLAGILAAAIVGLVIVLLHAG